MALCKCNECGKTISDKATVCPNCGCPIDGATNIEENNQKLKNRPQTSHKFSKMKLILFGSIGIVVVAGIVLYLLTGNYRLYNRAVIHMS